MKKLAVCFFLFLFTWVEFAHDNSIRSGENYLARVEFKSFDDLQKIVESNFKCLSRGTGFVIGKADLKILNQLKNQGLTYDILDEDAQLKDYYFVWYRGKETLSKASDWIETRGRIIYQEGKMFLVEGNPKEIQELPSYQMSLQKLSWRPLVPELPSPLEEAYKPAAHSPVIAGMINKVKTEDLLGIVKDLSGERSVLINGVPDSIPTRYAEVDGSYKAASYLLGKFQQMGIEAVPDTFYMPSRVIISSVKAARDGQTAWASTKGSSILETTNGGSRWSTVPGTEQYKLNRIFRLTDDTLWAVGEQGLAVNSTDKGESWVIKSAQTGRNLMASYFENNSSGWVVGEAGKIFYTSDGGTSWITQTSGTTEILYNITFSAPGQGWIAGANGKLLHTTDGGVNWSAVSSGTNSDLYNIAFVTPLKGWIVGAMGTVLYTQNGGVNWISKDVGTTSDIEGLSVAPDDTLKVWLAVFNERLIIRTRDGGGSWSSKYMEEGYFGIDFANSQSGWVTGGFSLGSTTDGGDDWTSQIDNLAIGRPYINVVAKISGRLFPSMEYLITAHYDDYSQNHDFYAPGADDNASGTVSVLEAASVMKDYQFVNTVKFVCVTAEEQGLIGSDKYASKARAQGEKIMGVLNFDMISYDGNHDGHIEVHTDSNSLGLTNVLNNVIQDYGFGFVPRKVIINNGNDYSDHASFWTYDYKAILGIEDDYDFNPSYHTTGDKISLFDTTYFRKFAQMGLATLATLAGPYSDLRGDVNLDLQVTVSDVVFLVNYLFKGGPTPNPSFLGDVNCSGTVDVSDVIYLVSYLFKGGPRPCSG
ncbi:MAG TPA: M20/M25/M40 family metallo-hydrolase [Terriglobales bacterium]|nr:M20/M25/M40 family metallo-hydrolase [Terriglobales bacterium]